MTTLKVEAVYLVVAAEDRSRAHELSGREDANLRRVTILWASAPTLDALADPEHPEAAEYLDAWNPRKSKNSPHDRPRPARY